MRLCRFTVNQTSRDINKASRMHNSYTHTFSMARLFPRRQKSIYRRAASQAASATQPCHSQATEWNKEGERDSCALFSHSMSAAWWCRFFKALLKNIACSGHDRAPLYSNYTKCGIFALCSHTTAPALKSLDHHLPKVLFGCLLSSNTIRLLWLRARTLTNARPLQRRWPLGRATMVLQNVYYVPWEKGPIRCISLRNSRECSVNTFDANRWKTATLLCAHAECVCALLLLLVRSIHERLLYWKQ